MSEGPSPSVPSTPAPNPGAVPRSGDPAPQPGHTGSGAGERRSRRAVTGAVLAAALLLGGGIGGYSFLRPADQPREDDPAASGARNADASSTAATPAPTLSVGPATTPSAGPVQTEVVYEVTGQGPADILYYDANGEGIWLSGATLPWRTSIHTDRRDHVMVQAGKTAGSGERIACSVTVGGGKPVTEETGSAGWRTSCFG
ncbi:MmpS family transport accessory protein [Micromonospora cremea]|uniref:Membrane protein n=1 Tax=Micromonospora cremea TaxID=709881 RepID=A0A1N5ZGA6_9ACTN|nr:MmpS family transport accessory protein [Micromonospora cremea]SIN20784.1 membrane protein [Micromonospora cremea]